MSGSLRPGVALFLLASLALASLPTAQAWSIDDPKAPPSGTLAAWTTDLSPRPFPTESLAAVTGAATCALGDVTGDGIADLAAVAHATTSTVSLEARAGPDFTEVVWRVTTSLDRVLHCAPDLDLDGTLDPIIRTVGETTGTAAGAAADTARNVVQQTLDGATGAALVGRVDAETVTGVTGAGVSASQQATALLLPAAEGAVALLEGTATGGGLPLPIPIPPTVPLPLEAVSLAASQTARLQVLDITGAVVATVEVAQAGVEPLALAPVQLSGALPDIAVLSQVTGPVQEAAAGVPELALYAADGTLAWATRLPATTGLPVLVPNAGDLDLDGVGDLIVTTVSQAVEAAPGAAYHVLSGVDGSVLFDSGPAVTGLVSALPLGQLPSGPALLEAALREGSAALTLQALGGAGQVLWSADVDALAKPVNAVLDPYTRDLLGFTDLTGDAVPDIAVSALADDAAGSLRLQVLDGVTGDIAWEATVPDAMEVLPAIIGPAELLGAPGSARDGSETSGEVDQTNAVAEQPGLEGAIDGVEEAAAGQASMLLAVGRTQADGVLTLIEGTTGEVLWTATALLPSTPLGSLTAEVAGDLTGDRIQDLLVTADLNTTGSDAAVVAVVSGATGETVWSSGTTQATSGTRLDFDSSFGPAAADAEEAAAAPGPAPLALLAGVALAAALLRRRQA